MKISQCSSVFSKKPVDTKKLCQTVELEFVLFNQKKTSEVIV